MVEDKWDRRKFVPYHQARNNVIPCDPLFTRLLTLAHRQTQRPAIRDLNAGIEKTTAELLSDAINFREVLRSRLRPETLTALNDGEEVYISLVAPGGYEFAVGILAILGLGAAASPFSPHQPVQEASYYVNKARSVAVVVSDSASTIGHDLAAEIQRTTNPHFVCVSVSAGLGQPYRPASSFVISSSGYRDLNSPGVVIFTSGTTGPPKGGLLPLAAITDGALSFAEQMRVSETDTVQHLLPVHHATGIWVTFFPFLLMGACIEFKSGSFSPEWTWNRWKEGGITHFSGVPTIYMRMMRHWQEKLSKLPADEREAYRRAPGQIRSALCGTSALPKPIDDFWAEMLNGRRIIQRYGSTEQGVIFNMPFDSDSKVPDGSAGEASLGVDVRLSEGAEGEVRSRSYYMFSKYIHDAEATKAAFDEDGYFKSGDMAERKGKYYFITGRASVDILKSGGYKISALDIEREILSLPYVNEVMVVGVPDDEFGQRVAAVLSLSDSEAAQKYYQENNRKAGELKLDDLRSDVRNRLAGYKLPTLLRVIEGELPKSATNKVVKKVLGPTYFPPNYSSIQEVQKWHGKASARQTKL
ncbi:hypothetical protein H2198_008363 [Neophaeococcomyces mojaviensis]|uniref:Uncharacterized protein n=1 Tax=Neophaeococcomyces mojaviensis TaxID=3383035 RepID=A0ACC2ZXK7_9EURO|nr:hypothetical protein H2198_008363 [Knufia sp. JES_112]